MKLLMTADPLGGVWTYALDLCAALQPLGVQVALATLGAPLSPRQQRDVAQLANVALHESRYRLEWMAEPWQDLAAAGAWLLEVARSERPDVVHLNHLVHADLAWPAPVLTVGHSCVLSWWRSVHGQDAPAHWQPYQEAVTRSLRAARRVIAPTRAMLDSLEEHYGPLEDGRVIPNARSFRRFQASRAKEPLILCAGRLWDEAKNVACLAGIAPRLSWPVHVAGTLRSPDGESASLPGIHLLGNLEQAALAQWYARAAIYALPARYEPFGLTALEAALSNCALVLGDIPSLREIWAETAVFVPPGDPEALHGALEALIAEPVRRKRLAAAARERALRFSMRDVARAYWIGYRELCMGALHRGELARPPRAAIHAV
jgi:glycogen synthase